jgi:hypothetical protein
MPPQLEAALKERAARLSMEFVEEALGAFTGEAERQYRPMIEAAQAAADAAKETLHHWVEAARRAGMSWTEVGRLLGISKQAAQQRFGSAPRQLAPFGTIVVTPGVGAASEEDLLAEEGQAGRELVDADATRLLFRQTERRWDHLRSVGPLSSEELADGWMPAAEWFVFHYYKRPC